MNKLLIVGVVSGRKMKVNCHSYFSISYRNKIKIIIFVQNKTGKRLLFRDGQPSTYIPFVETYKI